MREMHEIVHRSSVEIIEIETKWGIEVEETTDQDAAVTGKGTETETETETGTEKETETDYTNPSEEVLVKILGLHPIVVIAITTAVSS